MSLDDVVDAANKLKAAQNALEAQQASLKELNTREAALKLQVQTSRDQIEAAKLALKKAVSELM
jgi:predicted  nucleic acid-binding Zn-ribbon protein